MRSKILSFIMAALICSPVAAYASGEATMYDSTNGIIKVSGVTEPGNDVKIIVLNPGKTIDDIYDEASRQFIETIFANDTGVYSQEIKLSNPTAGYYKIYLKEGMGEISDFEIYYATLSERIGIAQTIIADPTQLSVEANRKALGISGEILSVIEINEAARLLSKSLKSNPIEFDVADTNEESLSKIDDLVKRINEIAVIVAYNQGRSELLFENDGKFKYDEIFKISTIDSDNNITVKNLYDNEILDTAVVRNLLLNKNLSSPEDLRRMFADNVLYYAIVNNKEAGFGHLIDVLTEENVSYAKNTDGKILLKTYLQLNEADRATVDYNIMSNKNSLTFENYISKVEQFAIDFLDDKKSPNKENGHHSSSNSSSSGIYIPSASIQPEPTKKIEFSDVERTHWAYEYIGYIAAKGIVDGVSENNFEPNGYLTREQAAKIICNTFNYEVSSTDKNKFEDVAEYEWFYSYISTALKNGIISGKTDTIFGVGEQITRQDFAVMIYRALKAENNETDGSSITDFDEISDYAKDAVIYLKSIGVISGYEDGTFAPFKNITRAEMAKIICGIVREGE